MNPPTLPTEEDYGVISFSERIIIGSTLAISVCSLVFNAITLFYLAFIFSR